MTAVTMLRTLSGLSPADEAAARAVARIKQGDAVQVEIHRPRRHKALRKWWLLCGLIAENNPEIKSKNQASDLLKILSGHCTTIASVATGECWQIPDSIAFSRLSEDEFEEIWRRAVHAVTEHILPGVTAPEIESEILQLIGAASYR